MPHLETREEFFDRHSASGVGVQVNNRTLFGEGASLYDFPNAPCEPPTDKWELLGLQRQRLAVLVENAETAFNRARAGLLHVNHMAARFGNY